MVPAQIGFDHGGPRNVTDRLDVTLILIISAFALGMLLVVAATTVPFVSVTAAPSTAGAPPGLGTSASPNPPPVSQPLLESPRVSVLKHDGAAGVAVAAIPAATSLFVAGLLRVGSGIGRRRMFARITAWTVSVSLLVAGIVGLVLFLVGIVAVPTGVLLVLACSRAAPLRLRAA